VDNVEKSINFLDIMMKKEFYETPEMDVLELKVEAGFLLSMDGVDSNYADGGEGDLMD
jgi:hypothetical protein